MRERVKARVDGVLRPLIEADGGAIELISVTERAVVVELSAACAGCPGMYYTRGHVIEPLLRQVVGDEVEVEVRRRLPRPPAAAHSEATTGTAE